MRSLGIGNTGRFNYHLKILNGLITKQENAQYTLTEKGLLASRLLSEFPENNDQQRKALSQKIWLGFAFHSFWAIAIVVLYTIGYIDVIWVVRAFTTLILFGICYYFIFKVKSSSPGSSEYTLGMKAAYIAGGIALGLGIAFFGVLIFLRIISDLTGKPFLQTIASNEWFFFFSLIVAPTIGGLIGYWLGKRKGFKRFELKIRGYRL
ncbi:hypothetical protein IMZ68_05005 [Candidatus Bathyarchaeota archaeon]|nr:hypothetical protein [Candidatus Bathyarchaeota archaeon]